MKKLMLTALSILLVQGATMASGIGIVDYAKIVEEYPLATKYKKELEVKANNIKTFVEAQENQIQKMKTAQEQAVAKRSAVVEIEKKQKDYLSTREARESELNAKIREAAEKVRVEKGFDVILKADNAVTGGVNITPEVLKKLK